MPFSAVFRSRAFHCCHYPTRKNVYRVLEKLIAAFANVTRHADNFLLALKTIKNVRGLRLKFLGSQLCVGLSCCVRSFVGWVIAAAGLGNVVSAARGKGKCMRGMGSAVLLCARFMAIKLQNACSRLSAVSRRQLPLPCSYCFSSCCCCWF